MAPHMTLKQFMASPTLQQKYLGAGKKFFNTLRAEEKEKLDKMAPELREQYIKDGRGHAARYGNSAGSIFEDIYKQYDKN